MVDSIENDKLNQLIDAPESPGPVRNEQIVTCNPQTAQIVQPRRQPMSNSLENINFNFTNDTNSIIFLEDELAIVDSILANEQKQEQQEQFVSSANSNSSQLLITLEDLNAVSNIYDETDDIVNNNDSGPEIDLELTSKCCIYY
jgi:hypothetical protein